MEVARPQAPLLIHEDVPRERPARLTHSLRRLHITGFTHSQRLVHWPGPRFRERLVDVRAHDALTEHLAPENGEHDARMPIYKVQRRTNRVIARLT
jgi:hypothetical protein